MIKYDKIPASKFWGFLGLEKYPVNCNKFSKKDNMTNDHPDPNILYPIEGATRTCFLKNIITNPQIIVGDYTYYDDPVGVSTWFSIKK